MLQFQTTLHRSPFPDEIVSADLTPPQIASEDDFACYAAFARPDWAPVLLSFEQKYRFMDAVLEIVDRHLDEHYHTLVMTCRVPGTMRFPKRFNDPRIIKVSSIRAELDVLLPTGLPVLAMHEGFVRHPMEQGSNEFQLSLHNPRPGAENAFNECSVALGSLF